MTAPTYSWTDVTDAQVATVDVPGKSATMVSLAHNIHHCQEIAYGSYGACLAHDHDGVNSALVVPCGPNLVLSSKWNDETINNGFDDFVSYNVTLGEDKNDGGAYMQTSGDLVCTAVGGTAYDAVSAFGVGAKFVVSLMVKSTGVDAAGELRFGLTDASTSTFMAGCRGSISYTQLSAGFTRFWFVCTTPAVATGLYFLARVSTTFTNALRVDAPACCIGTQLGHWWVSPMLASDSSAINYFLRDVSQNLAIFDKEISMRRAVKLTPV